MPTKKDTYFCEDCHDTHGKYECPEDDLDQDEQSADEMREEMEYHSESLRG